MITQEEPQGVSISLHFFTTVLPALLCGPFGSILLFEFPLQGKFVCDHENRPRQKKVVDDGDQYGQKKELSREIRTVITELAAEREARSFVPSSSSQEGNIDPKCRPVPTRCRGPKFDCREA